MLQQKFLEIVQRSVYVVMIMPTSLIVTLVRIFLSITTKFDSLIGK